MKFSLRNLILANCFLAFLLGALLGNPTRNNVQSNHEQNELIRESKNYSQPISVEEIEAFIQQRAAPLAFVD